MSIAPGLTISVVPGSMLLQIAATTIVEREHPPDLSRAVVIVANLFVVQPLQRALQRAANGATLLLPTITTMALMAETVPLSNPPLPDSRRLAWIHSALRAGNWFAGLDLWQVAAEVLNLIDDCARNGVALPEDVADFQRVVRQALRASDNHAIQFEARLVHELWQAMQGDDREIDRHGAYRLRLAELAARAPAPLYVVGLIETTTAEDQFLQRYAQRQPIHIIRADEAASAAHSPLFSLLHNAWNDAPTALPLMDRAIQFAAEHGPSPAATLRLFPAKSLEQEAQAVELAVRRWLHEGRRAIAIIAQDRLTARRARARLERAQILVADESGWTLSTTTASSAAMCWLEVIGGDFYFRNLFDLLHSPFFLGDFDEASRSEVVSELEKLLFKASFTSGLRKLRAIADRAELSPAASQIIKSLVAAGLQFGRKPRPLSRWLRALIECFAKLGALAALRLDAAGVDLLRLLQSLAAELEGESEVYSLNEWRGWLDRQLEDASFRDTAIESSVVLTHLGLTDGRRFDAVILLGADADHLPSPSYNTLFNDAVLNQLGLPSRKTRCDLERQRLMNVLAHSDAALITWQAAKGNEPNPPSPYWARLMAFHHVAYRVDLRDAELTRLLDAAPASLIEVNELGVTSMPRPGAASLIPESLSASDYASLIACPYQFYVRRMLALREQDEVLEAMEKKDYGELVHQILSEFHRRFPVVSGHDDALMSTTLFEISERIFQSGPEADYFVRAWRMRWEKVIPAYLAWQREREGQGWRWQASEVQREFLLEFAPARAVNLRGRLDRVDIRHGEANQDDFAVLDFKTGSGSSLKKRAANSDEDNQLPFYAILADPALSEPVLAYAMAGDAEAIAADHLQRLQQTFSNIAAGKGLPAQGIETHCKYCEAKGVCRKPYWDEADGG